VDNIREILTKAVIGKGKKILERSIELPDAPNNIDRILGAVMTNHRFTAKNVNGKIEVTGSYDIHAWYSFASNIKTAIVQTNVEYQEVIELVNPLRSDIYADDEIIIEEVLAPYATDVRVIAGRIIADVVLEVVVEVIGETKMRVAILGPVVEAVAPEISFNPEDDLSEIDQAIDPTFLESTIITF